MMKIYISKWSTDSDELSVNIRGCGHSFSVFCELVEKEGGLLKCRTKGEIVAMIPLHDITIEDEEAEMKGGDNS